MMAGDATRSLWHCGYLVTIHADAAETNGRFSLVEAVARRGEIDELPMHVHTCEAQYIYLLQGAMSFEVGEQRTRATAPGFIALPQDVPHRFQIVSERARFLQLYVPGGYDGFYRELSEPMRPIAAPAQAPRDVGRLITVAARYGVQIMSPASL